MWNVTKKVSGTAITRPPKSVYKDEKDRDDREKIISIEIGIAELEDGREVIGLLDHGFMTNRCYELSEHFVDTVLTREHQPWYIDAGTTCTEIRVEYDEWMRIMRELGVIDES